MKHGMLICDCAIVSPVRAYCIQLVHVCHRILPGIYHDSNHFTACYCMHAWQQCMAVKIRVVRNLILFNSSNNNTSSSWGATREEMASEPQSFVLKCPKVWGPYNKAMYTTWIHDLSQWVGVRTASKKIIDHAPSFIHYTGPLRALLPWRFGCMLSCAPCC